MSRHIDSLQNSNRNVNFTNLEDILRPLWKLTYYTGMLPEWCRLQPCNRKIFRAAQYFSFSLTCLSLLFICVFELVQLVRAILASTPISDLVENLVWCSPYPLNIAAFICYIYHKEELLSFFKDWAHFERALGFNVRSLNNVETKRWSKLMYISYLIMCVGVLCFLFPSAITQAEKSCYLSYYPSFRETFGVIVLAVFQVLFTVPVSWIFQFLSDAVPGLVFHHSAVVLQSLKNELENVFLMPVLTTSSKLKANETNGRFTSPFCKRFRNIWAQYETLSVLTKRANKVFSLVIVTDHLVKLFMICTLLFGFLNTLRNPTLNSIVTYISGSSIFLFRLVACCFLSAKVYSVSHELKESVSANMGVYCHLLSQEECEFVALFLSRLDRDELAARPYNLYAITPPTLLSLASAIITYVIVLLQSK